MQIKLVVVVVTIQKTASEQYFPVVIVITLYEVLLTFQPGHEIRNCDYANKSY